jgi:protein dithiol oxidoreductase (disulfide-forming)
MFTISHLTASRLIIGFIATLLIGIAHAQGGAKNVTLLDPPQPTANDGTIEVLEFFGYGCIHCANLEPRLEAWAKKLPADVKFKRVPSGSGLMGIDDIALFYTLEAMGQIERLHKKIFEAAHNERVMLGHKPTLLKWLEKQGVDPKQYESVERSFSAQTKIMRGRGLAAQYKINNTPTIVVNGRYAAVQAGDVNVYMATIDGLIAKSRAAQTPAKPEKATKATPAKAASPTKVAPLAPNK